MASSTASYSGPRPRTRSISDMKSLLMRPALTSHYVCQFSLPPGDIESWVNSKMRPYSYTGTQDLISLSCTEASLPGSTLATYDIDNDYHGVSEKHAYRRLYDDRADFTFYVDHDYRIIRFFEAWISYIVGESISDAKSVKDKNYFYRVKFPDKYQTDNLYITKFERDTDTSGTMLGYKFMQAFPVSINSMPVSYDQSQLLKCTVSFQYSRYVPEPIGVINNSSIPSSASGATSGNPETRGFVDAVTRDQYNALANPTYGVGFGDPSLDRIFATPSDALNLGNTSPNRTNRQVEAGLPFVGRNVGPIARFSDI